MNKLIKVGQTEKTFLGWKVIAWQAKQNFDKNRPGER
jgi:hypothetical protein